MLDWSQIDTVFLDMDGTLLDLHFDNYFWLTHLPKRYAEIHGIDRQTATARLLAKFNAIKGTLNWYCIDYWSNELQVDINLLKKEVCHLIRMRPYVKQFLHFLSIDNKRVVLTTNAHTKSIEIKFAATQLDQSLDRTISSHELGHAKEESAFWHALMLIEPFQPERTLFIDDTQSVLQSAEKFGIKYLITLKQPDSQQVARDKLQYPAIDHFNEIAPLNGIHVL